MRKILMAFLIVSFFFTIPMHAKIRSRAEKQKIRYVKIYFAKEDLTLAYDKILVINTASIYSIKHLHVGKKGYYCYSKDFKKVIRSSS